MSRIHLDNLWRWKCGLPEEEWPVRDDFNLEEMYRTEWSPEFIQGMRNRLVFGAIRYGKMGHGSIPHGKPEYDRVASIRARLDRFEKSGNAEWLFDIANMALLIYEEHVHPNFHFDHVDGDADDSYHDKIVKK